MLPVVLVDTHAFKEAFVEGRAVGFVVADESSPRTNFGARPGFAEIDVRDSYCIFEDRAMAEQHIAKAVIRNPKLTGLAIREVNVQSIRDYQLLAGRKAVFLVDRAGQTTQSLRVGDMPLAARTNTPFPGPLPRGTRFIDPPPTKPAIPSPPAATSPHPSADTTPPMERVGPRKKPTLHGEVTTDPFSHERNDNGAKSSDSQARPSSPQDEKPPGWLDGVLRRLRGKD